MLTKVHSALTNESVDTIQDLIVREQRQGFLHNTETIIDKHMSCGGKPVWSRNVGKEEPELGVGVEERYSFFNKMLSKLPTKGSYRYLPSPVHLGDKTQ